MLSTMRRGPPGCSPSTSVTIPAGFPDSLIS
jgi:hypothetical protein